MSDYVNCSRGCDGLMSSGAEQCSRCTFEDQNRAVLEAFGVPWPEGGIRYATVILRPEQVPCVEVYMAVPPYLNRRFRVVDIGDARPGGRPSADNPLGGYEQKQLL